MNSATLLSISLFFAPVALAQGVPVPKYEQCPTHTSTQGGSCVPNSGYSIYWNDGRQCPVGWWSSKGYCWRSEF